MLIRTLQRTLGITVFMVTHDLDSLNVACDRIAALADGKIVAEGPMETLLASDHPWVKAYFRGRRGRSNGRSAQNQPIDGQQAMEIRARYFLVGLFVLVVAAAVVGFIYWLYNTGGLAKRTDYRVSFNGSVSGLAPGSPVLFNGLQVGEVTGLSLSADESRPGDRAHLHRRAHAGAHRYPCRHGLPRPDRHAPRWR